VSEGPTAEDAVQVAQRALAKVNELEREQNELAGDLDEALEELTALRLRVQERDEDLDYSQLKLNDKVGMVREHVYRKAVDGHGRAKIDYDDVMWSVFDGEPGPSHCYKLMRLAAAEEGDDEEELKEKRSSFRDGVVGFAFRDPDGGNKHLAVDADLAQQGVAFYPENKAASTEGGSR